jgi:hypothetical protein
VYRRRTVVVAWLTAVVVAAGCGPRGQSGSAPTAHIAGAAGGDDILVVTLRSAKPTGLVLRDPMGRVSSDLVSELPGVNRRMALWPDDVGNEGGEGIPTLVVEIPHPANGVWRLEVTPKEASSVMLEVAGYWGDAVCSANTGEPDSLASGTTLVEADYERTAGKGCQIALRKVTQ